MKAVIIGAGAIGCGFAGQLLHASGYELLFVCHSDAQAACLNQHGRYRVRLVNGRTQQEEWVTGVRAVCASDEAAVADEIAGAGLIVTAVGANNLAAIASLIAAGLQQRQTPLNVLALENLADAGQHLRAEVARHLPATFPLVRYGFSGAIVSRAVTERLGGPGTGEPLTYVGDPSERFVVDGHQLCHPYPSVQGMVVANDYRAHELGKLYLFSAGHAVAAYLGHLKGYRYLHAAIHDPEIRETTLAAMRESQNGLAASYGQEIAGDEATLQQIIGRFENAALNDHVIRVARDPYRKLRANDRLVGAARLAQAAGVKPRALVLGMAAALCFCAPDDPSAVRLQQEIQQNGIRALLKQLCELDSRRGFGRRVVKNWQRLIVGQQPGNLLLNLKQLTWAW